jgi:hypothetical protein
MSLLDSIYRWYPVGSLLMWSTKERLQHEREVGGFVLPTTPEDYPVNYVLDGQQRFREPCRRPRDRRAIVELATSAGRTSMPCRVACVTSVDAGLDVTRASTDHPSGLGIGESFGLALRRG